MEKELLTYLKKRIIELKTRTYYLTDEFYRDHSSREEFDASFENIQESINELRKIQDKVKGRESWEVIV